MARNIEFAEDQLILQHNCVREIANLLAGSLTPRFDDRGCIIYLNFLLESVRISVYLWFQFPQWFQYR